MEGLKKALTQLIESQEYDLSSYTDQVQNIDVWNKAVCDIKQCLPCS